MNSPREQQAEGRAACFASSSLLCDPNLQPAQGAGGACPVFSLNCFQQQDEYVSVSSTCSTPTDPCTVSTHPSYTLLHLKSALGRETHNLAGPLRIFYQGKELSDLNEPLSTAGVLPGSRLYAVASRSTARHHLAFYPSAPLPVTIELALPSQWQVDRTEPRRRALSLNPYKRLHTFSLVSKFQTTSTWQLSITPQGDLHCPVHSRQTCRTLYWETTPTNTMEVALLDNKIAGIPYFAYSAPPLAPPKPSPRKHRTHGSPAGTPTTSPCCSPRDKHPRPSDTASPALDSSIDQLPGSSSSSSTAPASQNLFVGSSSSSGSSTSSSSRRRSTLLPAGYAPPSNIESTVQPSPIRLQGIFGAQPLDLASSSDASDQLAKGPSLPSEPPPPTQPQSQPQRHFLPPNPPPIPAPSLNQLTTQPPPAALLLSPPPPLLPTPARAFQAPPTRTPSLYTATPSPSGTLDTAPDADLADLHLQGNFTPFQHSFPGPLHDTTLQPPPLIEFPLSRSSRSGAWSSSSDGCEAWLEADCLTSSTPYTQPMQGILPAPSPILLEADRPPSSTLPPPPSTTLLEAAPSPSSTLPPPTSTPLLETDSPQLITLPLPSSTSLLETDPPPSSTLPPPPSTVPLETHSVPSGTLPPPAHPCSLQDCFDGEPKASAPSSIHPPPSHPPYRRPVDYSSKAHPTTATLCPTQPSVSSARYGSSTPRPTAPTGAPAVSHRSSTSNKHRACPPQVPIAYPNKGGAPPHPAPIAYPNPFDTPCFNAQQHLMPPPPPPPKLATPGARQPSPLPRATPPGPAMPPSPPLMQVQQPPCQQQQQQQQRRRRRSQSPQHAQLQQQQRPQSPPRQTPQQQLPPTRQQLQQAQQSPPRPRPKLTHQQLLPQSPQQPTPPRQQLWMQQLWWRSPLPNQQQPQQPPHHQQQLLLRQQQQQQPPLLSASAGPKGSLLSMATPPHVQQPPHISPSDRQHLKSHIMQTTPSKSQPSPPLQEQQQQSAPPPQNPAPHALAAPSTTAPHPTHSASAPNPTLTQDCSPQHANQINLSGPSSLHHPPAPCPAQLSKERTAQQLHHHPSQASASSSASTPYLGHHSNITLPTKPSCRLARPDLAICAPTPIIATRNATPPTSPSVCRQSWQARSSSLPPSPARPLPPFCNIPTLLTRDERVMLRHFDPRRTFSVASIDAFAFLDRVAAVLRLPAADQGRLVALVAPVLMSMKYSLVAFPSRADIDAAFPISIHPAPGRFVRVMVLVEGVGQVLATAGKLEAVAMDLNPCVEYGEEGGGRGGGGSLTVVEVAAFHVVRPADVPVGPGVFGDHSSAWS